MFYKIFEGELCKSLGVPPAIVVCFQDTFDDNFEIKKYFTKHLWESYWDAHGILTH